MISYAVSELEEIFKTKFYLSEKELKEVIVDVVSRTVERKSDAVKIIEGVALELHMKQSSRPHYHALGRK